MNLRNNLLMIVVLAICSTSAQAQFVTVINLPDTDGTNPPEFSGDSIGDFASIPSFAQLNVFDGGSVGNSVQTGEGSEVNILGGTVGNIAANNGSTVNVSGGDVRNLRADSGSTLNISGGAVDRFGVGNGSTVNISGGNIGVDVFLPTNVAENGSMVNLFGTEFYLDGEPLDNLLLDTATLVPERGDRVDANQDGVFDSLVLSGLLADGTPFEFDLNPDRDLFLFIGRSFFDRDATLTVTRVATVPEPGSGLTLATISVFLLGRRRKHALRS